VKLLLRVPPGKKLPTPGKRALHMAKPMPAKPKVELTPAKPKVEPTPAKPKVVYPRVKLVFKVKVRPL